MSRFDAPSLAYVDGWGINIASIADAVHRIVVAAKAGEGFSVFTLNMDHLVKLRLDPQFRRAYKSASFITADGAPIVRLAAREHRRIERTTGADLIIPLAEAAAREDLPIYLFGTTADVLAKSSIDLAGRNVRSLNIAGSWSPSVEFDPQGPEAELVVDRIIKSGARLCFVALGAPKQELFAAHAIESGARVGFVCIGAGLDFIAGTQLRAPRMMQAAGLEWLWRLASNPRRLGGRYARCALLLGELSLIGPMRNFLGSQPSQK